MYLDTLTNIMMPTKKQLIYLDYVHPELYQEDYNKMPIFDAKDGIGTIWEDDKGTILIAKLEYGCRKRKARLVTYTWKGISPGAVHYYGSLIADGLVFTQKSKPTSQITSNKQPENTRDVKIRIRRPLPQEEFDKYPERYEGYHPGDYVECFYNKKDIIDAAEKIFKEKFTGNWKFVH